MSCKQDMDIIHNQCTLRCCTELKTERFIYYLFIIKYRFNTDTGTVQLQPTVHTCKSQNNDRSIPDPNSQLGQPLNQSVTVTVLLLDSYNTVTVVVISFTIALLHTKLQ